MAHLQNPRRFYIDRAGDQPVVRRVPVRPASAPESVATHQITPALPDRPTSLRPDRAARLSPRRVTELMRSARRHTRLRHA